MVAEAVEKGSKLVQGKIVMDEEKRKNDSLKKDDEISMDIIKEIAESIDDIVKFSVDLPSTHKNEKNAILDLEVNVNKEEQNIIDFEFYE